MYADDLVLMSDTLKGFRNKFLKWKEALDSKNLTVYLGKTKVVVVSSPHLSSRYGV